MLKWSTWSTVLLDGVDGEPGHGVVDSVVLSLADGLHAAGLVLDIHVVEGHVQEVNAGERIEIIRQSNQTGPLEVRDSNVAIKLWTWSVPVCEHKMLRE